MPPLRKTIKDITGKSRTGDLISVEESTERFSDVRLADGTLIRIKASVVDAVRVDGEYDAEGNPVYVVQSGTIVRVVEVRDDLRKKIQ